MVPIATNKNKLEKQINLQSHKAFHAAREGKKRPHTPSRRVTGSGEPNKKQNKNEKGKVRDFTYTMKSQMPIKRENAESEILMTSHINR